MRELKAIFSVAVTASRGTAEQANLWQKHPHHVSRILAISSWPLALARSAGVSLFGVLKNKKVVNHHCLVFDFKS